VISKRVYELLDVLPCKHAQNAIMILPCNRKCCSIIAWPLQWWSI